MTSVEIKADLNKNYGITVSARTIRSRLQENNLNGRIARKKPNVSKKKY